MVKGSGAATAALQREIAKLRALAASTATLAPRVGEACLNVIVENVEAGRGPDGTPWQPTKAGGIALRGDAHKGLAMVALGSRVVITLDGSRVYHHRGQTRGNIARPILPTRGMPQPMTEAVRRVVNEWFEESRNG